MPALCLMPCWPWMGPELNLVFHSVILCLLESGRLDLVKGKYTKPSATYVEGLALAIGRAIHDSLPARMGRLDSLDLATEGLESVLTNEVAVCARWETKRAWSWPCPVACRSHQLRRRSLCDCKRPQLLWQGGFWTLCGTAFLPYENYARRRTFAWAGNAADQSGPQPFWGTIRPPTRFATETALGSSSCLAPMTWQVPNPTGTIPGATEPCGLSVDFDRGPCSFLFFSLFGS